MIVTWRGVNGQGKNYSAAVDMPPGQLLAFACHKLDLGWTALSVMSGDREVAGIQDFGDGHYEAWLDLP